MLLKNIIEGIEKVEVIGNLDLEISKIELDSRKIKAGDLFIAINGNEQDGHKYVKSAIENGAIAVLVDQEKLDFVRENIEKEITILVCENTNKIVAKCACNFYENPSTKFKLIGITGTKGKTTTTFMIREVLKQQGFKVGLIGTIANYIGDIKLEESDRTTPDAIKLQGLFAKMAEEKCDIVVMEVSSQGLKHHRVDGSHFDIGVFTNFSEDHISKHEHPDMEDYFNSKLKLMRMCKINYINSDDVRVRQIPEILNDQDNFKTYGIDNECDILARDITITNSYVDFKIRINDKNERVRTGIPGRFSVYNTLAALSVALKLGCSFEKLKDGLKNIRVLGRNELVDNKLNIKIMIDYAHSPKSLESILESTKEYTQGKVISVFGCGGDRDTSKRPIMGEISGRIADYTIITSDNPRTEDPKLIVDQIEEGIKKTNGQYTVIVDRTKAIRQAIKMAKKIDMIVLSGKGHETYQEINHVKNHYDEREIITEISNELFCKRKEEDKK